MNDKHDKQVAEKCGKELSMVEYGGLHLSYDNLINNQPLGDKCSYLQNSDMWDLKTNNEK